MIQKIPTPSKVAVIWDCTLANFCLSLFVLEENILFEATLFVGKVGKEFFGSAGRSRTWLTQSISVVETVETSDNYYSPEKSPHSTITVQYVVGVECRCINLIGARKLSVPLLSC